MLRLIIILYDHSFFYLLTLALDLKIFAQTQHWEQPHRINIIRVILQIEFDVSVYFCRDDREKCKTLSRRNTYWVFGMFVFACMYYNMVCCPWNWIVRSPTAYNIYFAHDRHCDREPQDQYSFGTHSSTNWLDKRCLRGRRKEQREHIVRVWDSADIETY